MKKRLVKHYFNMVEIALALAVLAIGMSSILVLFPVGINANKSAIADNNLADVAEYLMGYLRASCAAEWAKGMTIFLSGIPKGYENLDDLGLDGIDLSKYSKEETKARMESNNLHYLDAGRKNAPFLYQQLTGDVVDFAAVIRVWREDPSFIVLDARTYKDDPPDGLPDPESYHRVNEGASSDTDTFNKYATVLCIEISWPAQAPYDQRDKRLFRQEIFNEAYRYE